MFQCRNDYSEISEVWFGIDQVGEVAAFDTNRCARSFSEHELRAQDRVDKFIESLEGTSDYRMSDDLSRFRRGMYARFPVPERMESLGLYALEKNFSPYCFKGLFAYAPTFSADQKASASYFRVCSPCCPIRASDFAPDIRQIIEGVCFANLRFESARVVDVVKRCQVE